MTYDIDRVAFFSNNRWSNIKGKVRITNYRILFFPDDFSLLEKAFIRKKYFHYIFTFIEEGTYINKKEWDFPVEYRFVMKDMSFFSVKLQPNQNLNFLKIFEYILSRSKIEDFRSFFAFRYHEECKKAHKSVDIHWDLYDIKSEMKRQGIYNKIRTPKDEKISSLWSLIDNSDYMICSTYPAYFIVPTRLSKSQMLKSAEFRTKNRLPALVYALKIQNPKNKETKYVTLWRSSQIMVYF